MTGVAKMSGSDLPKSFIHVFRHSIYKFSSSLGSNNFIFRERYDFKGLFIQTSPHQTTNVENIRKFNEMFNIFKRFKHVLLFQSLINFILKTIA